MSSEKYRKAMHQIAPQGFIWPDVAEDSNLGKVFDTIGDALLAVDTEASAVLNDLFPDSTGDFLSDWERITGLPRCGITGQTVQQRRDMVLAWLNVSSYSNKQFFIDIAAVAGFTITVEDRADDGTLSAFEWRVTSAATAPVSYFRTGESRAGEPLVNAGSNNSLECLINFFAPAHTSVLFVYV